MRATGITDPDAFVFASVKNRSGGSVSKATLTSLFRNDPLIKKGAGHYSSHRCRTFLIQMLHRVADEYNNRPDLRTAPDRHVNNKLLDSALTGHVHTEQYQHWDTGNPVHQATLALIAADGIEELLLGHPEGIRMIGDADAIHAASTRLAVAVQSVGDLESALDDSILECERLALSVQSASESSRASIRDEAAVLESRSKRLQRDLDKARNEHAEAQKALAEATERKIRVPDEVSDDDFTHMESILAGLVSGTAARPAEHVEPEPSERHYIQPVSKAAFVLGKNASSLRQTCLKPPSRTNTKFWSGMPWTANQHHEICFKDEFGEWFVDLSKWNTATLFTTLSGCEQRFNKVLRQPPRRVPSATRVTPAPGKEPAISPRLTRRYNGAASKPTFRTPADPKEATHAWASPTTRAWGRFVDEESTRFVVLQGSQCREPKLDRDLASYPGRKRAADAQEALLTAGVIRADLTFATDHEFDSWSAAAFVIAADGSGSGSYKWRTLLD